MQSRPTDTRVTRRTSTSGSGSQPDNARRLTDALEDFGFPGSLDLTPADFQPDAVIQLGYPPKRIDILTAVDGLTFEQCYPLRMTISIDDVPVPFIDLENLRRNKTAAGRPQDLADLAALNLSHRRTDESEAEPRRSRSHAPLTALSDFWDLHSLSPGLSPWALQDSNL